VDSATDAAQKTQQEEAARKLYAVPEDRAETTPMRPPEEVLEEMRRASERYDELMAQQRELHFAADPSSNRVIVEVRDLDGNVLKTIPPSKALDVISGGSLD
jgi:flagellar protein FlaG